MTREQFLRLATPAPKPPGKGWQTALELSKTWGLSLNQLYPRLRALTGNGDYEVKRFPTMGKDGIVMRPHYRPTKAALRKLRR